jgi:hypothetical protein
MLPSDLAPFPNEKLNTFVSIIVKNPVCSLFHLLDRKYNDALPATTNGSAQTFLGQISMI